MLVVARVDPNPSERQQLIGAAGRCLPVGPISRPYNPSLSSPAPAVPKFEQNISLRAFNTFGIEAKARHFVHCRTAEQAPECIERARANNWPTLILGGGSNVLFTRDYPGLVMRMESRGITLLDGSNGMYRVRAAAGESWHDFVMHTLDAGWPGLENLSLIPGTVGAAPIQNIGAYGVELDSMFDSLEALEIDTGRHVTLDRAACRFGYRDSVFKHAARGKYAILSVTIALPKDWRPQTGYRDVRAALDASGIADPTPRQVSDAVIAIRRAKLPDPAILGNAGSFFKNPLVSGEKLDALKTVHTGIVSYAQADGRHKLAAAWLIDQAGWKGRALGGAAVHDRQALVLVNRGGATGADVAALARAIQADILARFGVALEPEPEWL